MRTVLAYREQHPSWAKHPLIPNMASVFDHMNAFSPEEAGDLGHFMRNCMKLTDWISPIRDPVDPSVKLHSNTYTDGEFFWNGMLTHFVSKYRADIPNEFKEALRRKVKLGSVRYELTDLEYGKLWQDITKKIASGEYGSEFYVTI